MYDRTLEAAQTLSDPRRTLRPGTLGRGDGNATTTGGLGRRGGVFGQGLVKLQERRGEKRGEEGVLLQASTRREPATSAERVNIEANEQATPSKSSHSNIPRQGNRHRTRKL